MNFNELIPEEIDVGRDFTFTDNDIEEQEASPINQEIDNLTDKMANLLATYRAYKEEPHLLNADELAIVEHGANMIIEAINRNRTSRNRPNQHFTTQRR